MRAPLGADFRDRVGELYQFGLFPLHKLARLFNQRVRFLYFFLLLGALCLGRGDILPGALDEFG